MTEKADFSKFGKTFQDKLTYLILTERVFADQLGEVLDVNFLEYKYLQSIVRSIYEYKEKYEVYPSLKIMATLVRNNIDDDVVKEQAKEYLLSVLQDSSIVEDCDYVKETSLDFCKKQKLKEAMMRSVKLLNRSSFDEISTVINEALKLGTDVNFGYDYKLDFEERFKIKQRDPITTGWKEIDAICKGGLGNGELGVVIAPTGAGKSMALVHLGAQAVKLGKTVIHYTLEMAETSIAGRYDSCITGLKLKEMFQFKEQIHERVKDIEGNVIIKEYPTKSATTTTIKNHLERIKSRGIKVDMIIVDYADLLRPVINRRSNEKRHDLESIYEELRGLSQVFECPIWTASQTNRSGLNAEIVTMEAISEAFNKCFVADFICTISRTVEDKKANKGRIFVAKNRNGIDGVVFPIRMDTSNVNIKVLSMGTVENGTAPTVKSQSES
ncbi:MAG: DnaB-like helicase C-terminal domain-containing protein, partial [Planctomycetota bacterium]